MTLHLSVEQARNFLTAYHLRETDLPGVFARLGTVPYDPLNPVGRNPDLVLQARVPGYQVDDWQRTAYIDRLIYDLWDKQASHVLIKVMSATHFLFGASAVKSRFVPLRSDGKPMMAVRCSRFSPLPLGIQVFLSY